jgi:hypothetical protein
MLNIKLINSESSAPVDNPSNNVLEYKLEVTTHLGSPYFSDKIKIIRIIDRKCCTYVVPIENKKTFRVI